MKLRPVRRSAVIVVLVALLAALLSTLTSTSAQAVGEVSGGVFVPVSPSRLIDTAATGGGGAFAAAQTRNYQALGVAGVPATGVSAIVIDVAATSSTVTSGALTMWSGEGTRPNAVDMYFSSANVPRSNTSVVKVGTDGKFSVYNYYGTTGLNIDIQGYFTDGSTDSSVGGFVPVTPIRVARSDAPAVVGMAAGQVPVGASRDVQVTGDDIPADATAVFANIEVRNTTVAGQLKVGPGGSSLSTAPASVNYGNNGPVSSGMTIQLDSTGKLRITNASGSPLDIRVDVQGYFSGDPTAGGSFNAMRPEVAYATSLPGNTQLSSQETRRVKVTGIGTIPDDSSAGAVVLSVTARGWQSSGSLTMFNPDDPGPLTGVSFLANQGNPSNGITTTAIIQPDEDGYVNIYNSSSGPITVYLMAQGWFSKALPPATPCTVWLGINHAATESGGTNTATCDGDLAVEMLQDAAGTVSYRLTNVETSQQETGSDLALLGTHFVVEEDEPDTDDPTVDDGPAVDDPTGGVGDDPTPVDGFVTTQATSSDTTSTRSTTKYFARWIGSKLVTQGKITLDIRVVLYWHSANVKISTSSNRSIYSSYKLRIRNDVKLGSDHTVFTFPSVYQCSVSKYCTKTEDRYGDGYDELPYESKKKYFYDVYLHDVRYDGRDYPTVGSFQSNRITCYKTVACKFR